MSSEAPGTTTSAMILALPPDVLERVARCLDRRDDVRNLRLACSGLRGPAALAVRRLRAPGGRLPAKAWAAFPAATGLVIDLGYTTTSFIMAAGLLPGLPERVEGLSINCINTYQEACDALLLELLAAPLAQRLRHLKACSVLPETARQLLPGLPRLQRCELSLRCSWSPGPVLLSQFPAELQQLDLGGMHVTRSCRIDCAALGACAQLHSLRLGALVDQMEGLPAFLQAAGARLQHLHLQVEMFCQRRFRARDLSSAALTDTQWQLVGAMPRLHSLSLPEAQPTAAQWEALAAAPSLRELDLATIELASGSPPAAALTKLSASSLELPEGAPPGMLATLLPRLQHIDLHVQDNSRLDVVAALRGHPALRQLDVRFKSRSELPVQQQPWPAGVLSSMPQLRTVRLEGMRCRGFDAPMQDAAGCPQLEALAVELATWCDKTGHKERLQEPTIGAGLAALAGGACRGTLRRLVLYTQVCSRLDMACSFFVNQRLAVPHIRPDPGASFSVAAVAQLLRALPQLRELQATVQLPREGSGGGDTSSADESEGEEGEGGGEEGDEGDEGEEGEGGGDGGQGNMPERLRQHVLQLLLAEGGAAAELTCAWSELNVSGPPPVSLLLRGTSGGCKLSLRVWLRKGDAEELQPQQQL
jgi:hypothetical protein